MINFFIINLSFFTFYLSPDLNKLRNLFPLINKNESYAVALLNSSNNIKTISAPLNNAYKAAAQMALAKYKFNPISKLSEFNQAKITLNDCVKKDSLNLEIRYIRLAIQEHVPAILNYYKNIDPDKKFIIQNLHSLKQIDPTLFTIINNYLRLRGYFIGAKK